MVLVVRSLPAIAGDRRDAVSLYGSRRVPGRGNGNPLHYSCLENPMGRGTWQATVHGVAKTWTWTKWISTHAHEMNSSTMALQCDVNWGSKIFWKFDICFWQAGKNQIQHIIGKIRAEICCVCACDGITYYKWKWFRFGQYNSQRS